MGFRKHAYAGWLQHLVSVQSLPISVHHEGGRGGGSGAGGGGGGKRGVA